MMKVMNKETWSAIRINNNITEAGICQGTNDSPTSPGNLSHFRANLETNCNSFYFSTVLFCEVPRMTY